MSGTRNNSNLKDIKKSAEVGIGAIGNVRIFSTTMPPQSEDLEEDLKILAYNSGVKVISWEDYRKTKGDIDLDDILDIE